MATTGHRGDSLARHSPGLGTIAGVSTSCCLRSTDMDRALPVTATPQTTDTASQHSPAPLRRSALPPQGVPYPGTQSAESQGSTPGCLGVHGGGAGTVGLGRAWSFRVPGMARSITHSWQGGRGGGLRLCHGLTGVPGGMRCWHHRGRQCIHPGSGASGSAGARGGLGWGSCHGAAPALGGPACMWQAGAVGKLPLPFDLGASTQE